MKILLRTLLVALPAFAFLPQSGAQQHDDADHTLEVHRALPAFMIEGPHYRIVDPVVNRFALDEFTIESDFGTFEAIGQLHLRIRLREIQAIAALQKVNSVGLAAGTLLREGKKTVTAVAEVGRHPIKSAKGLAAGLGNRFKKWTRDVGEDIQIAKSRDLTRDEKKALISERWLGVDDSRRRIAGELFVDPYTDNPALIEALDAVARADATVNLGTKFLVPKIPGTELMLGVHKIVTTYDVRQLLDHNRQRLVSLGAVDDDIDYFLNMEQYNPTASSLLISLILELDGVQNQLALFDQALVTDSNIDALFFIESVAMAVWYHNNEAPLTSLYLATGLPAGRTSDGQLVVFAATDFPHWTHVQADVVGQLDEAYKPFSAHPMLLLAGNASGEFKRELANLGWSARSNLRDEYLPSLPWAIRDDEMQAVN